MAKKKALSAAKAFKHAAPPWGDRLPETQPPLVFSFSKDEELSDEALEHARNIARLKYVDVLYSDARKVDPILLKIGRFFINDANEEVLQVDATLPQITADANKLGPPKEKPRILKKGLYEKNGKIHEVTDCSRSTIAVKTPLQLAALCTSLEWHFLNNTVLPGGARIVDWKNRVDVPTASRYRSGQAKIAIPVPGTDRYHITEMMITHGGFERDIKSEVVQKKLNAGMKGKIKKKLLEEDSHSVYEWVRYIEERYSESFMPKDVAEVYQYYRDMVEDIHDKAAKKNHIFDGQVNFGIFMTMKMKAHTKTLNKENNHLTMG